MTTTRRIFCLHAVAWSPDSMQLAIGGTGTTVRILDAVTLAARLVYRGRTAMVISVTWSPDGHYVASSSQGHSVQVWSSGDGAQAAAWPLQWPHRVASFTTKLLHSSHVYAVVSSRWSIDLHSCDELRADDATNSNTTMQHGIIHRSRVPS